MGVVTVGAVCLAIGLLIGRGTSTPTPSAEPLVLPPMALNGTERVTAPQVSGDGSGHAVLTTKPTVTSLTPTARAEPLPLDVSQGSAQAAPAAEDAEAEEPPSNRTTRRPQEPDVKPVPAPVVARAPAKAQPARTQLPKRSLPRWRAP